MYYFCYGQDAAKQQTAGKRPKIPISPNRGDSLHQFTRNLAWPRGTWLPLGSAKFHANWCTGVGTRSKKWKYPLLVKSCPACANPLTNLEFSGFFTPNNHALVFYILGDSCHWLQSYCWETACQSFTLNFSVGKTVRLKNDWHLFNGFDVLYHHAKFNGDWTTHAGCRSENMAFACFYFCMSVMLQARRALCSAVT